MAFDTNQQDYKDLRDILKQRTNQVIVWCGAGLSAPAGLPSWSGLRDSLIQNGRGKISHLEVNEAKRMAGLLDAAENTKNLWESFKFLKDALYEASFVSAIRSAMEKSERSSIPPVYENLWKLGIRGMINLNIDRFAARSYSQYKPGANLSEFNGIDSRYHTDIFRGGTIFLLNAHGTLDNKESWVFTPDDFNNLSAKPGYLDFIKTCFLTSTVLFVGVSADDRGAGGHLSALHDRGISLGGHFWLTNRNDTEIYSWAQGNGIRQIFYSANGGDHSELHEAIRDIHRYIPEDTVPLPVVPSTTRARNFSLPEPSDIERLTAEEIRQFLNKEAVRILGSNHPERLKQYAHFLEKYDEAIHRAWSVSSKPGRNQFFDYQITDVITGGAFGQVYRGLDSTGSEVAIKILHSTVKENNEMLQSFRRGVNAMEILSARNVAGMVPYIARWEIPASTVMEYVNGYNLQDAVEAGFVEGWHEILDITLQLTEIIRSAHSVPEHVLHRDIRPANVMLRHDEEGGPNWDVVVLDFDLAWHKDAMEVSISPKQSMNGYLAPEQINPELKSLTRNALVDAFGLGMTLFYVVSRKHPAFSQQRHVDWREVLRQEIVVGKSCKQWVSLPRRFMRLIYNCTLDKQADRFDLTRISGELQRLLECLSGQISDVSCELLAEEIAARSREMAGVYEWESNTNTAILQLRSGYSVTLQGDEANDEIRLVLDWSNEGDKKFENVKKYIGTATEKCCKALRDSGWEIEQTGTRVGSTRIIARISAHRCRNDAFLSRVSEGVSAAIRSLMLS